MTMLAVQFAAGLFAACGIALVWKLVTRWVKQAPLRNIPGPPSKSLWSGQSCRSCHTILATQNDVLPGNMGEVFDLRGWKFHADIAANYGRIVKLNGILGVSTKMEEFLLVMLNFVTGRLPLRQRYPGALSDTHQRSIYIRRTIGSNRVRDIFPSAGGLNRRITCFLG